MQPSQRELFELACQYPWYHFTAEGISALCNVGEHKVRFARNAKDTPFRLGLCRPEWFSAWMLNHPEYRDLKSVPINLTPSVEACAAFVKQTLRSRPKKMSRKTKRKRVSSKRSRKQ